MDVYLKFKHVVRLMDFLAPEFNINQGIAVASDHVLVSLCLHAPLTLEISDMQEQVGVGEHHFTELNNQRK